VVETVIGMITTEAEVVSGVHVDGLGVLRPRARRLGPRGVVTKARDSAAQAGGEKKKKGRGGKCNPFVYSKLINQISNNHSHY
jgi:hypothetical protein